MADETALPATIVAFDRDGALVEAEQAVRSTRRAVFAGAAAGAVLGALGRTSAARASGASKHDIAILNYALGLEYIQASFYTEAERLGALHGSLAQQASVVGSHERAHVAAFREVLGAAAIKRPMFNFRGVTEDPDAFRRYAVAFEDLAVAAYKYQAPRVQSPAYLAAAVAVHSVEARHAAWIRRLAGVLPAASAFDQPLPPGQVETLVASTHFIVSAPQMAAHSQPRMTG